MNASDAGTAWFKWTVIGMSVAAAVHVLAVFVLYPTEIYWLTYYVNNYEFGFVRRGLGGQLLHLVPERHYFTVAYTLLWAPVVVWFVALAFLVRHVLTRGVRSNRRLMLGLLIPVLPFAITYGLYTPRPELYALSALVAFGIASRLTSSARSRLILSAVYGVAIAILAFFHEGIPLALALGAVLVILVGPAQTSVAPVAPVRRENAISIAAATGPGLLASVLIGVFARKDVAAELCALVPHRQLDDPYAASADFSNYLGYLTGRIQSTADYHDWACRFGTPMVESDLSDGVRLVAAYGIGPLVASFAVGVLFFAVSVWAVQRFSGVRLRDFAAQLRHGRAAVVVASALYIPLFVTAVDWTRWWILIAFNVMLAYVLFAADRPETDEQPPRGTLRLYLLVVAVLAILPTGAVIHVGGPTFEESAELTSQASDSAHAR